MIFYIFVRGYAVSPLIPVPFQPVGESSFIFSSFPSFIHAIAVMLIALAVGLEKKRAFLYSLTVSILFEMIPPLFGWGTLDGGDVLAICLGVGSTNLLTPNHLRIAFKKWGRIFFLFFGGATSMASYNVKCYDCGWDPPSKRWCGRQRYVRTKPVYLNYDELRNSFAVEEPKPLRSAGKILALGSRLLVSEPNVGVHVFDNSDPSAPQAQFFLNILGNVDIASKGQILYADSFVDLLAIRLDGDQPELVKRIPDTFFWNPYQAINDPNVTFEKKDLDRALGVVVGTEDVHFRNEYLPDSESRQEIERGSGLNLSLPNCKFVN